MRFIIISILQIKRLTLKEDEQPIQRQVAAQ